MAEEPKSEAGGKPPRSPLVLILAVCAAVMAGAAGSMYFMLKKMGAQAPAAGAPAAAGHQEAKAAAPEEPPPAEEGEGGKSVVTMAPFVVNLEDENGESHFLKMTLAVELKDGKWSPFFEHQTPKVRNAVVLLLSNLKTAQTQGAQNKRKLVEDLRTTVSEAMGKNAIKDIFLTEFVIQ